MLVAIFCQSLAYTSLPRWSFEADEIEIGETQLVASLKSKPVTCVRFYEADAMF